MSELLFLTCDLLLKSLVLIGYKFVYWYLSLPNAGFLRTIIVLSQPLPALPTFQRP